MLGHKYSTHILVRIKQQFKLKFACIKQTGECKFSAPFQALEEKKINVRKETKYEKKMFRFPTL